MDSRRYGTRGVDIDTRPLGWLLLRYGYYFSSLVLIVVFMAFGLSPFRAVLYATVVAFALGFLNRETRWTPRRLFDCLAAGTLGSCRWWRCGRPPGSSWPWCRSPAWGSRAAR